MSSPRHARAQVPALRRLRAAAGALALALTALLVWQTASATFASTTSGAGSTFGAGTVTLSDDDTGTALVTTSGLIPGSTGENCITVGYGGTLAAAVRVFVAPGRLVDSGLAAYLTVTLEEGTGGSYGSCSGFVAAATDYGPGSLAGLAAASTSFGSGAGSWAPTGPGQARVYHLTYTLDGNEAAAGGSAQLALTWEARST